MAHYPADIELPGLMHKDLGHFLSGKERPLFRIIPFGIYVNLFTLKILRKGFSRRMLLPRFFTGDDRFSGSLQLLFRFFCGFSLLGKHVEAFKIQPAVLGVRLYELFRLLTVQLPFKIGYTLLQTVDFCLLLRDYGILVRQ